MGKYTNYHSDGLIPTHDPDAGIHKGDIGHTNIMFVQDVVHHGKGGVYIGKNKGSARSRQPLSIDDIHKQIDKAKMDEYDAEINKKKAQLEATKLKEDIAKDIAKKKRDELKILDDLDRKARVLEKEKPEILGKKAIPVVNFTEESNPLKHHIRMLNSKIESIKETERKSIEAQKNLTRLDDITDNFKFGNIMIEAPDIYKKFLDAGNISSYSLDIPVTNNQGDFYLRPESKKGNESLKHVYRDRKQKEDHAHYEDHEIHV